MKEVENPSDMLVYQDKIWFELREYTPRYFDGDPAEHTNFISSRQVLTQKFLGKTDHNKCFNNL